MSHIVVATDFSDVAENAVHHACRLSGDLNVPLLILHSFLIPVTFSDTPMPIMPVDEGRGIAEERLGNMVSELKQQYPQVTISSKIMFGDVIDCLEEYSDDNEAPLMIILGNSGSGDSNLWFGSNVVSALRNLKHTVMAVPLEAAYKKPENICFACDFNHPIQAENLLTLIQHTNAQLHVLNVNYQAGKAGSDSIVESTELHHAIAPLNPVYHYVEKEDVDEGIHEFVEANHMDWLVLMPQKHSFFEGLFHKSHTKAMVRTSNIPIVALHEQ